ncbi:UDP-N-acetylmuramoyl-tripeptide--D-alanyl-D-alanine ligase [Corynebacterium terpenotabidum]|uniref:UDP-N-acetylmuramoyl-tripeptide--D-alanyl-D-alanine ligase n=1 Tax=Corynebacterium terpenotabidum Y-11 TaxID=1200352 RepID=S4XFZ4_9CORY|nr:UDP-N-acetylmuramoyl-tripeptide--D-alanyl-D-alanine ligase [Corynebacterium terpenotabidum]AGP30580.1 UDP-N-acetylmuramoylalanyl-D-glutamyl-2, 6-diaminopimelate-D-alanyl-D-alanine ligase [Corynebacterium terpenotabidum Y-11]
MIDLTAAQIAEITGGTLIDGADPATPVSGPVEFDSRRITPGSVYMALPGARVDGHDFAAAALDDGAALVLAGRPTGGPALLCPPVEQEEGTQRNASYLDNDPDGLGERVITAVSRLARYSTDVLVAENGLTVIGVTGSAGKTSTKDLLGAVFSRAGATVAPPGSLNNEIGHPYTVLKADRSTRYLIAEMSARGQGHIARLARIAPPRIGVVLNVGTAHLGEFGSRDGIARAKGELVEALPPAADGGVAVLNADDDLVAGMAQRTTARVVFYSATQGAGGTADYRASDVSLDEVARASFLLHHPAGDPVPVRLGVFGAHNVANALAAAAAAIECGLDPATVADALTGYTAASANRMDVRTRPDGLTVINDSYNANPDSMRAGIDALVHAAAGRPGKESWAVLGQMAELGEETVGEHAGIGDYLADQGVDRLIVVGAGPNQDALARTASARGMQVNRAADVASAITALSATHPGDVVLVKASYSDGLWRVAEGLHADARHTQPSPSTRPSETR